MANSRPTNKDLLNKIEESEVHSHKLLKVQDKKWQKSIGALGKVVMLLQDKVNDLAQWRYGLNQVEEFKKTQQQGSNNWLNKQLVNIILVILGMLGSVITYWVSK